MGGQHPCCTQRDPLTPRSWAEGHEGSPPTMQKVLAELEVMRLENQRLREENANFREGLASIMEEKHELTEMLSSRSAKENGGGQHREVWEETSGAAASNDGGASDSRRLKEEAHTPKAKREASPIRA
eukprot:gnl/TRDRNA2_/TRDRNA2_48691_c0_seq1.p1 gnl/TRDRNA2_/TRDRNA2_48691_c0~~gnl/TRDRNA2_/TRDRNA2_48691_c0_seq1.p1  ORF type:complete len:128 (+),score=24.80 gnl/TRDRNA2_/TRDRNA2_48691_c0_seq1:59-442(+)